MRRATPDWIRNERNESYRPELTDQVCGWHLSLLTIDMVPLMSHGLHRAMTRDFTIFTKGLPFFVLLGRNSAEFEIMKGMGPKRLEELHGLMKFVISKSGGSLHYHMCYAEGVFERLCKAWFTPDRGESW